MCKFSRYIIFVHFSHQEACVNLSTRKNNPHCLLFTEICRGESYNPHMCQNGGTAQTKKTSAIVILSNIKFFTDKLFWRLKAHHKILWKRFIVLFTDASLKITKLIFHKNSELWNIQQELRNQHFSFFLGLQELIYYWDHAKTTELYYVCRVLRVQRKNEPNESSLPQVGNIKIFPQSFLYFLSFFLKSSSFSFSFWSFRRAACLPRKGLATPLIKCKFQRILVIKGI